MKMSLLVLCCLTAVAVLVTGCATGRNGKEAAEVVTVREQRIVSKFILPGQKIEALPFLPMKVRVLKLFPKEDLVPAAAISPYLEALARAGQIPFRVQEGLITRKNRRWLLVQGTASTTDVVPHLDYYVVDMDAIVCP